MRHTTDSTAQIGIPTVVFLYYLPRGSAACAFGTYWQGEQTLGPDREWLEPTTTRPIIKMVSLLKTIAYDAGLIPLCLILRARTYVVLNVNADPTQLVAVSGRCRHN